MIQARKASDLQPKLPIIKIVGVSASGKSTLVRALREAGYDARAVSQEHSHMADLWKQFEVPRVLIYLDNDLAGQQRRRPDVTWDANGIEVERVRLADAYAAADLRIQTASLTSSQVAALVLAFLAAENIRSASTPLPLLPSTGGAKAP